MKHKNHPHPFSHNLSNYSSRHPAKVTLHVPPSHTPRCSQNHPLAALTQNSLACLNAIFDYSNARDQRCQKETKAAYLAPKGYTNEDDEKEVHSFLVLLGLKHKYVLTSETKYENA